MTPTILDYLILLRLSEFPKNTGVRSKFLAEKVNEKIMTTGFSRQAVAARLRIMAKGGFVEKHPNPNPNWNGTYVFGYWKITDHGRSQIYSQRLPKLGEVGKIIVWSPEQISQSC